ncbi:MULTISPECIES: hypothetical protein [unclassified Tolypothrix]|uniref:hypothetical protein n=1 Tax=unclassified Tolypothrix TaxID=2649714 RepID=UPI0005EAC4CB|nr:MULTISPECIES: hypothetical protein [unclassified Tolypothrix]EKE96414.1 hypothetical protein FDUTEX481_09760 [Tolypothrix sp. PCC 7601]MBE9084150.1 hypothetical protein [Tolypothrix sp. LEGE 11397]UYD31058.1 hypothetical protein HGR01_39955 [Tolypothrix sp. PCC 7712]
MTAKQYLTFLLTIATLTNLRLVDIDHKLKSDRPNSAKSERDRLSIHPKLQG